MELYQFKTNGEFYANTEQTAIGVKDGGRILAQCVLIKHRDSDFVSLAFFEACEGAVAAVDMLVRGAEAFGTAHGACRIVVGLDGHMNYSIGLLAEGTARSPMFGESFNPAYYHDFFGADFERVALSAHYGEFDKIFEASQADERAIATRLSKIKIVRADFRSFDREIARYGEASNRIFHNHPLFFDTRLEEDIELWRTMRPLLDPCSIIFAKSGCRDVGYLVMYPDYNELVKPQRGVGIATTVRFRLSRRRVRTVKLIEVAVDEHYRASGATVALFAEACRQIRRYYPSCERVVSGWIHDENRSSRNIATRYVPHLYAKYTSYVKKNIDRRQRLGVF